MFAGEAGPASDIVALNAGAAIYVGGLAEDLGAGVTRAQAVLADGSAARAFTRFIDYTQSCP